MAGLAVSGLDVPRIPWLTSETALAMGSKGAWCFGVMADTQWKYGGTEKEQASTCAVTIVDALNDQFIQHKCKFVVQVGDLVDKEEKGGIRTLPTRAEHCQALYDAGIGFFPVRGNHESTATAAQEMPVLFPQTLGDGEYLYGASNFNSPSELLKGLSYSFDYQNVRCVFIDQFVRPDGTNQDGTTSYNNNALDQVDWVDKRLALRQEGHHAFVFAHKNLIGGNHKDSLFGSDITSNPTERDAFITSLYKHNAGYFMSGHDHMHHRSLITTSEGTANIDQIICSSNSYKFYIPQIDSDGNAIDDGREKIVSEELFTIGYYIVTVDGARVTMDYYASSHGLDYGDVNLEAAPESFTFYLRERFGYSLNGDNFTVNRGEAYTSIEGRYKGTVARILNGADGNKESDYTGRAYIKTANTGWDDGGHIKGAVSNVFSLWGLADNLSLWEKSTEDIASNVDLTGFLPAEDESQATDVYTLAMTCMPRHGGRARLMSGKVVIAARTESGEWVNAVDLNNGENKKEFVRGPWKKEYGLGTYGVDPRSFVVWAVLDHEGDFVLMEMPRWGI